MSTSRVERDRKRRPRRTAATQAAAPAGRRDAYRHGDLRRALIDAGVALARAGGPDAIVLREATRQAGVVPNAAYRHFASREDLLDAVRAVSLASLAYAMTAEVEGLSLSGDAAADSRAKLRAIGAAYIQFARREPGLFRTAFAGAHTPMPTRRADAPAGEASTAGQPDPFLLLGAALDEMVSAGVLPTSRRAGAEYLAWSAVHGWSMLVIDGPLRRLGHDDVEAIATALLAMVENGI